MKIDSIDPYYRFNNGIDYKLEDKSHEFRALAIIRFLFPDEPFSSLTKSERPDFISTEQSVGLEVTDVTIQKHRQASKEFFKYKHSQDLTKKNRSVTIIRNNGAKILSFEEEQKEVLDFDVFSSNSYINVLENRINDKEEKSNEYAELKELDLALLFDDPVGEELEAEILKSIEGIISDSTNFNKIFIISNRFCIRLCAEDHSIVKKELSKEDDLRLKILGRLTAEGTKTLESPEWN